MCWALAPLRMRCCAVGIVAAAFGGCVSTRPRADSADSLGAVPLSVTDSVLGVSAEADGLHLSNRIEERIAYTVYERVTLLERNADRDSCMLSPVAQCPSIAPRATIVVRYDAAVHNPTREAKDFTVRFWRAGDPAYPRGVSRLTVRRP